MKFSTVASASILASIAIAHPVHHAHKREAQPDVVVTVPVTNYVTVDGNAPPATSVGAAVVTVPAPVAPASSLATSFVAAAASPAAESPSVPPSSSAPAVGVGSGGALGITYSPYSSSGGCKSASEVASDLAQLTGYSVIRLYGVDCDQVANVYAAKTSSQKLFLGIFDVADLTNGLSAIKSGINSDWSAVQTISIGNELVNSGSASVAQVQSYVDSARSTLTGYGYTGPVVAVDTFIAVLNNPGLCDISDYIAINAHAFFDSTCEASNAGNWALSTLQSVSASCGGKKVVITESGWPSEGSANGAAIPGTSEQQAAISAIKSSVGSDVLLFTAFNDLWKAPGAFSAEQFWGILN